MKKYTCNGFNSVSAESINDAANIFANRAAEYSAFIGRTTGPNETSGHNINFTVFAK